MVRDKEKQSQSEKEGDIRGERLRDRASNCEKVRITGKLARKGGREGGREGEAIEIHPNMSIQLHLTCPTPAIQPFAPRVCVRVFYRVAEACSPSPCASHPGGGGGVGGDERSEQRLQVKIQAFEEKMGEEVGEVEVEEESPAPQRRYSLSQAVREERREMRFNRSVNVWLFIGLCCVRHFFHE